MADSILDVDTARAAGATDDQIADFLAQKHGFNLAGAKEKGASSQDIIQFLGQRPIPISGQILPTVPGGPQRPSPADVSQGFDKNAPGVALRSLPALGATAGEVALNAYAPGAGLLPSILMNAFGGGAGSGLEKLIRSDFGQNPSPKTTPAALAMGAGRAIGAPLDYAAEWLGNKFHPETLYQNAMAAPKGVNAGAASKAALREDIPINLRYNPEANMSEAGVAAGARKEVYNDALAQGARHHSMDSTKDINLEQEMEEALKPYYKNTGQAGKGGAIDPNETRSILDEVKERIRRGHLPVLGQGTIPQFPPGQVATQEEAAFLNAMEQAGIKIPPKGTFSIQRQRVPFDEAYELQKSLANAGPGNTTDLRRSDIESKAYKAVADRLKQTLGERWQPGAMGKNDLGFAENADRVSGLIELEKAMGDLAHRETKAPIISSAVAGGLGSFIGGRAGYDPLASGSAMVAANLMFHASQNPELKSQLALTLGKMGYAQAAKVISRANEFVKLPHLPITGAASIAFGDTGDSTQRK